MKPNFSYFIFFFQNSYQIKILYMQLNNLQLGEKLVAF